ncbi:MULTISPECIES: hypothetical protein [Burkholderia]|uniref:Uncharacterized protein n=2 Tax=Burkholderia cepacia complex TaxID=87882 RepID=A0ABW7L894_9BURK|nr:MULTISPECIES: hypothetical protein [Burkholderia]MBP0611152.1 hypothetical protein [Burkholderia sp. CpTa8-5]MDN8042988.1 hypothetical protein [Burkholderia vietnamiensis]HDR9134289.1 hypothetical protein [Burkholderia vietnamiensis]
MTKPTTTTSSAALAASLQAARRSPNPSKALLAVADAIAANPAQKYRAEAVRFAAKRLEVDPFDADAAASINVIAEDYARAARWDSMQAAAEADTDKVPHNLIFPLARGQAPTDAMPVKRKLSGRSDYYAKRAAMSPEELEEHDAANADYASRVVAANSLRTGR